LLEVYVYISSCTLSQIYIEKRNVNRTLKYEEVLITEVCIDLSEW